MFIIIFRGILRLEFKKAKASGYDNFLLNLKQWREHQKICELPQIKKHNFMTKKTDLSLKFEQNDLKKKMRNNSNNDDDVRSSKTQLFIVTAWNTWNSNYSQFHQHFLSSFCADILVPKNYKAKLDLEKSYKKKHFYT